MSGFYTVDLDGDRYYVTEWKTGKRVLDQGFEKRGEAMVVTALFNLRREMLYQSQEVNEALENRNRTPRARSVAVKRG